MPERILLAAVLLCTLGLTWKLWDQPGRIAELSARVDAMEKAAPPAISQEARDQHVAAGVVQALRPRLDQLAQGNSRPSAEKPPATSKPELTAEQAATHRAATGLVNAAIARGRLEDADAAQLRGQLRTLAGTAEGRALLARVFAAMNQGKLRGEWRNGLPPFMP